MRCAGLFLIVEPDKVILLCAKQSYNSIKYYDSRALQKANFLEKISIPRGKRDGRDVFDYETAIREFIEETGTFFESAYVYRVPFQLRWNDAGAHYKYSIYVGIVRGYLTYMPREPNSFCVKLLSYLDEPNKYKINIETRRYNNELPRNLYISTLDDYFKYMNEKQLYTYDYSNYIEFFEFVKRIKKKFDCADLGNFFRITLKLDKLDALDLNKWIVRRTNLVAAMKKKMMDILSTT